MRLGSRALKILQILAERAGEIVDKKELAHLVWPDTIVEETNIRVHVSALRRVLGDGQNGARYILNVPGRGYGFSASVSFVFEPFKPDRTLGPKDKPASKLPDIITRLVGRDDAVTKLKLELAEERIVVVVGPGGIGKTSLALAAAQSWSSELGYEACFVDLATVTDPSIIPVTVASAISASTISEDIVGAMLRELQGRRFLIILDNCEHVIEATASLCEILMTGAKEVRFLATSREPLRVSGEWLHHLSPLSLPPADQDLTASEAMDFPSVQLFVERAMANGDTYELTDVDAPIVAGICRRLDGNPLAIEFAAARIDILDVRTIARRLDDRFALLTKGRRTALHRHQTLRATLDWSYALLSPEAQIALRGLSAFATHFSIEDAIEVVGGETLPRAAILESLDDLVAKSMVAADVGGDAVSYRLLETTQVYAHEKLVEAGELEELRRRHAQRFLSLCRAPRDAEHQERLPGHTMADVRVALDWALVREGDIDLGINLASAATPIALRFSLLREHRKYLELALAHMNAAAGARLSTERTHRTEIALRIALTLALYYTEGSKPTVDHHLAKALEIAQKIGDRSHELEVRWMRFGIACNTGKYRQSLTYAEEFSAFADTLADPMPKLRSHRLMGRALAVLGQYSLAQDHVDLALRLAREAVSQPTLNAYQIDHWVASRANRARIRWLRGYPDDAKTEAEQCIAEALRLGHEQSTCWALTFSVCPIAIWRGDFVEAKHFVNLLRERSKNIFQHYYAWAILYDQLLSGIASAPNRRSESLHASVKPTIPAQTDLLATFDINFLEPDALARAQADEDIWCTPEILRAWAVRHMSGTEAEATLARSIGIARRHGAKAWELRAATSLALHYRESGRIGQGRGMLESALSHFTQGRDTKDVQAAADLLSQFTKKEFRRPRYSAGEGTVRRTKGPGC